MIRRSAWFFVVGALLTRGVAACDAGTVDLNPQPLPPTAPDQDDGRKETSNDQGASSSSGATGSSSSSASSSGGSGSLPATNPGDGGLGDGGPDAH